MSTSNKTQPSSSSSSNPSNKQQRQKTSTSSSRGTTFFESIGELSSRLDRGEVSSEQMTKDMLDRIREQNPVYNAYSDVIDKKAIKDAIASDQRRAASGKRGILDGIPIAVKDIIDTTPAACSSGLKHLKAYKPKTDAEFVKTLRQAGAVIVGVTHTDSGAFGTSTPQVINPVSSRTSAGGSSGGSAAAVAGGLAYGALGTDTGGSIRIPSACCFICGLKPTFGTISVRGVRPLAPSLDHVGPMARNTDDLAILFRAMCPDREPAQRAPLAVIGLSETYHGDAQTAVKEAFTRAIDVLKASGLAVKNVSLPTPEDTLDFHMKRSLKEAADYHTTKYPDQWKDYPDVAKSSIERGRTVTDTEHKEAGCQAEKASASVDRALRDVDAITLPTLPVECLDRSTSQYKLGNRTYTQLQTAIRYTALFDQTGHPVVSLPAITTTTGKTISVQLVGKKGSDHELLAYMPNNWSANLLFTLITRQWLRIIGGDVGTCGRNSRRDRS